MDRGTPRTGIAFGAADPGSAGREGRPHLWNVVGATPLLPLSLPDTPPAVTVWAKAEWLNPGGSVKDRAARGIVSEAERAGQLDGRRLLDASSGNTAIAYAMLGALRGFRVTICLPGNASSERKRLLAAYGVEVIETDPVEGSDGAIRRARALAAEAPDRYFYADQYNNAANAAAHYATTGPEIWRQTAGSVTHVVVGVGTTGTLMGTGRYLRERRPGIELVAVEPDSGFHGIEGLKHLPSAMVPGIYDPDLPTRTVRVRTEEAYEMMRRLARETGYLVGPSSGAAAAVAGRVVRKIDEGEIVVIFPDGGDRYLSLDIW